jgi:MFS family permease
LNQPALDLGEFQHLRNLRQDVDEARALLAVAPADDRYGAARVLPYAVALVGIGCVIFAPGTESDGMSGFVLQAIGAVFSSVGASYVAARYLPARMFGMFMGLTQCLGMLGAAFGSKPVQVAIDPAGPFRVSWQHVWLTLAVIGFVLAIVTWFVMPRDQSDSASHHGSLSVANLLRPFGVVLKNRQSWLAGITGGLLFAHYDRCHGLGDLVPP